jgi:hypothetical protein
MSKLKQISPDQLLITRREAARMLGRSVDTIIRLERAGKLTKIKLNPDPNAAKNCVVALRRSEVEALVNGTDSNAGA